MVRGVRGITVADGAGNIAYRLAFNTLRETYEHVRVLLAQALQLEPRHARTHRALRDLQRSDEGLPSGKSDPQRKN